MNSAAILDQYLEERNQLLHAIIQLLKRDATVKAAWLFGSLGRGNGDVLSDIDVWVVVEDDLIHNITTEPLQYTSQIGHPILSVEAPQNAPEGGAYMMTCYDAPVAPHIVDWYWQPLSRAYISGQVRLLFDRVGLIHRDQSVQFPSRPAIKAMIDRPNHFISFFWMMLMITAKYAYRSPWAEQMELLPLLIDPIVKAQQFLGQKNILQSNNFPPHRLPSEKIHLLYELADQMRTIMTTISETGEEVPFLIPSGVNRYLKMIELVIEK